MERISNGNFSGEDVLQDLTNSLDDVQLISSSLESTKISDSDESPPPVEIPKFLRMKYDLTECGKLVFNHDNSVQKFNILKEMPDLPPNELGTQICVIDADFMNDVCDPRSDGLGKWNTDGFRYSKEKVGLFFKDGKHKAVTRNLDGASDVFIMIVGTHPKWNKIKKRFFFACPKEPNDSKPVPGTFFVLVYDMGELYVLSEIELSSRLSRSTSRKLNSVILNNTGTEARDAFYQNGGFFDKQNLPTLQQIRSKQSYSKEWGSKTTRGPPRNVNTEEVRRIIDRRYIVRTVFEGDDPMEERYLIGTKAHFYLLLQFGLYPQEFVQKFVDLTDELRQYSENERDARAKELIRTILFEEHHRCGQASIDITFNLGSYNVTVLLVTLQHINGNGKPYNFVPAIMLSKERKKEDIQWFASELEKRVGGKGKCFRSYASDGEASLDVCQEFSIFANPCTRKGCDHHKEKNVNHWCDNDQQIVQEIFGVREDGILRPGLIHEYSFETFYEKVTMRATSDEWFKYEKLKRWAASESKLRKFYDRHNILSSIAAGYGFERSTTDPQECQNQLIKNFPKYHLKDRVPLQDLFKGLEKFMVGQLLNICHVFFDNDVSCQLRDQEQFLGTARWAALSEEEIRDMYKKIGLIDTDLLPGLQSPVTSFPALLAANTNEIQRQDMVAKAKTYTVTKCVEEPGIFFVRRGGTSTRTIDSTKSPITCECKIADKNQLSICLHSLAVAIKFPDAKILEKQEDYIKNETAHERNRRLTRPTDGSKTGTSRRYGYNKTRNPGKNVRTTKEILRLDSDVLSSSSTSTLTGGQRRRRRAVSGSSSSTLASSNVYVGDLEEPVSQKQKVSRNNSKSNKSAPKSSSTELITLGDSPTSTTQRPRILIPISSKNRLPTVPEFIRPENTVSSSKNSNIHANFPSNIDSPPLRYRASQDVFRPLQSMHVPTASASIRTYPQAPRPQTVRPNPPPIASQRVSNSTTNFNKSVQFNEAATKHNHNVQQSLDNYIDQHGATFPSYFNYYPFVITKVQNLSGWKERRCVHCANHLGSNAENIVVVHFEAYEHPSFQGSRNALRAICPTKLCMNQRYPYIDQNSFISDLSSAETTRFLRTIVRNIR